MPASSGARRWPEVWRWVLAPPQPTSNSGWISTDTVRWSECNVISMAGTESASTNGRVMNKKQLSHLEKRLMEERARVMKELGYYDESFNATLQSADGDLSSYSFHMADQGTDAMEREKQFLFASQEGRYLWHVNEALRRLYGTPEKFGHCQQCGQEINFERLDALPHARLCITCKEKEEDGKRR